ncbi:MAG: ROK family transcriptional regulator [Chitinophagaceae bacterium]|nr:ROK family transcriptional regulator [Chitinophagaceae bacterium]
MASQHQILEVFSNENASGVAYKNKALKRSLINLLDQGGNTTITELSRELNISVPKTTSLVNELIEDGLLKDYGKVDSTGGRRASIYGLVPEACFFVGVDVKRYYVNLGLLDFKKQLVATTEKVPFILENTEASLNHLLSIINNFIEQLPVDDSKLLSMGISLSGRINTNTGYNYSYFNFPDEPLSLLFEREIGIRTFLENDSRVMAYGEYCCGEVQHEKNVMFLNMDYGIGLGILIDGEVYYGKSGFSGELGHTPFFENNILCYCGKKGCLETEASGAALVRNFKQRIADGATSSALKGKKTNDISLLDIIKAAKQQDTLSIELLADLGAKIGRGLAVLINVFNPELLILGGTLSETGNYLLQPIRNAIGEYSLSLVNNDTQMKVSKLGEKAGVMGSCLMARNKVLTRQE